MTRSKPILIVGICVLCGVIVIGAASLFYFKIWPIIGSKNCVKKVESMDEGLEQRLKSENQTLGRTTVSFFENKCYEDINYSLGGIGGSYSYIENISTGQILSECTITDSSFNAPDEKCAKYNNDFNRFFHR